MSDGKEYVRLPGFRVVQAHRFNSGKHIGQTSALVVQGPRPEVTIPYSLIGPDSEAWREGDEGWLQLERWKAEELGLILSDEPARRPLPKRGDLERAVALTVQAIIGIIRNEARNIAAHGAGDDCPEAMCDCGEESLEHEANPIGWHRARFAAKELERVACCVEKACMMTSATPNKEGKPYG